VSLTGIPLVVLALGLATALPVLLTLWWRRRTGDSWLRVLRNGVAVVLCQLLAASALFLWVNRQYGFYTSWSDLAGRSTGPATVRTNGLVPRGSGRVQVLDVPGRTPADPTRQALVWLPPQYDQTTAQGTPLPVVMVLPGQPSTPEVMFRHFDFGRIAAAEILAGHIHPFVAVFPPLMTDPPRDTECTDIPGGPHAQTWLTSSVYQATQRGLRTASAPWSIIGWSTGAFCAAKLVLTHPRQYQAAVALGGYYTPLIDKTTGDLFHHSRSARNANSPSWLYQHGGLHHRRLLLVSGRQDRGSWRATQQMLQTTAGDPNVSSLTFPTGGHNYRNYRRYLHDALRWLDQNRTPH
jgi:S-formylglutathione hydrolase FrmB